MPVDVDDMDVKVMGKLRWPKLFLKRAKKNQLYTTTEAAGLVGMTNSPSTHSLKRMMSADAIEKYSIRVVEKVYWGLPETIVKAKKKTQALEEM